MRLKKGKLTTDEYKELESFNNWILSIGNGKCISTDKKEIENNNDTITIEIPKEFLIHATGNKIEALVQSIYPELLQKYNDPEYIKNRTILATTNEIVDQINNYIINLLPTIEREYFSVDNISKCTDTPNDANILYPVEYLNTLNYNNFHHID